MRNKAHIVAQIRQLKALGVRHKKAPMPRQAHPKAVALAYYQKLRQILEQAKRLVSVRVIPKLEQWEREAKTWRGDAADDEVNDLLDDISAEFFDSMNVERLKDLALVVGRQTSDFQKAELAKQVRSQLGVDVVQTEPWLDPKLRTFASENVALIKSMSKDYFSDVEKLVLRSINEGARPEDIAADLEERFGVSESKAALIARDQVGKLVGDLNEQRQKDLGVSRFIWRTSNDERVRPSHAELEGQEFEWSDPPIVDGEEATPGSPIQCRCVADPVLDDVEAEATEPDSTPE